MLLSWPSSSGYCYRQKYDNFFWSSFLWLFVCVFVDYCLKLAIFVVDYYYYYYMYGLNENPFEKTDSYETNTMVVFFLSNIHQEIECPKKNDRHILLNTKKNSFFLRWQFYFGNQKKKSSKHDRWTIFNKATTIIEKIATFFLSSLRLLILLAAFIHKNHGSWRHVNNKNKFFKKNKDKVNKDDSDDFKSRYNLKLTTYDRI